MTKKRRNYVFTLYLNKSQLDKIYTSGPAGTYTKTVTEMLQKAVAEGFNSREKEIVNDSRFIFSIDRKLMAAVGKLAKKNGVSKQELIRQVIDLIGVRQDETIFEDDRNGQTAESN